MLTSLAPTAWLNTISKAGEMWLDFSLFQKKKTVNLKYEKITNQINNEVRRVYRKVLKGLGLVYPASLSVISFGLKLTSERYMYPI
jgi:hypothetical protein